MILCYVPQGKTAEEQQASTERPGREESKESSTSSLSARNEETLKRTVCWDLDKRGDVGETALHLCLLFSKQPKYRRIALALLTTFPLLALDYYEDDEYYGKLLN